jgi:hypothetical protein
LPDDKDVMVGMVGNELFRSEQETASFRRRAALCPKKRVTRNQFSHSLHRPFDDSRIYGFTDRSNDPAGR